ncbi:hypothetical protein ACIPSJ_22160 [Streptomyces sp. NPDC090088]|uniref:nSTAND1 domain-containing NTPase n=1 Tax=Streptomyces sp. NPDC090088 TaxID=3365944 RepID=UPI00381263A9
MGRREKPVDPGAGPVQRLAHDLRVLREEAGRPTYREMARRADYSASALSQAAAGEQLPSRALVLAYAAALDADVADWEKRWCQTDLEVREALADRDAAPPYRGLARFETSDRELFFGRDKLVAQLLDLAGRHRFAAVLGPSGSGKSSLLRAGLIPALREIPDAGRPAVIRVLTPGERPSQTHADALIPLPGEGETWVIVDQFEELFTLGPDPEDRDRFLRRLLAALSPENRLRVVVAVRADFYGHCAEHPALAEALSGADLLVGPMTSAELTQAVTGPATAAGLTVERALATRIVDEVGGRPGALPLLSHALLETWRRRRGRSLTTTAYEEAGGVRGAIAATAEELYADLSPAQARIARRVLLRLIALGDDGPDTRRPVARAELDPGGGRAGRDLTLVVERLAAARLITLGDSLVELAHEALISAWPRLRGWIEEDRERLREQRMLGEAARAWEDLRHEPGTLYRGTRLARAEELFPAVPVQDDDLIPTERAFLTAALDARAAERTAVVRNARRLRTLRTVLSAFLVLSLAAGLLAWQQHRSGEQRRAEAAARRVAAVADGLRLSAPRTAMLLGAAAWRIAPLTETRSALLGSLAQPEVDAFTDPEQGNDVFRYLSGRSRTLLTVVGRRIRLTDVRTHRPAGSFRLPANAWVADVSPDGRTFYLGTSHGDRLWTRPAGQSTVAPRGLGDAVLMHFAADGAGYVALVASRAGSRNTVQLRRQRDDKVLFEAPAPENLTDTALDGSGRNLAVCSVGGPIQVWDTVRRERLPGPWDSARQGVCRTAGDSLRYSFDGTMLAVVSGTGAHVWDIRHRRLAATLSDPGGGGFHALDFTPDGAFVATADARELAVWRPGAAGAKVFRRPLAGGAVQNLAWAPGKDRVLRLLDGATVHSYDLTDRLESPWQSPPPDAAALSPDGALVAVADRQAGTDRLVLRSTRTGAVLAEPPPMRATDAGPPLLAFSPDGRALATNGTVSVRGSRRERVLVWDVLEHRVRAAIDWPGTAAAPVYGIALGPGGGRVLVSGLVGDQAVAEVWDTADGRPRRTATLPGFSSPTIALRPDSKLVAGSQEEYAELPAGPVVGRALSEGRKDGPLAFSPDGSRLAVGDSSGRVYLWDGHVRRRTGVLTAPSVSEEPSEAVTALAFSPDGGTLAVGGARGGIQLWDVASQQPLGTGLPSPGDEIRSLAFGPDGGTVYATGRHVVLQRYTVAPQEAVTRICERVGGAGLSPADWKAYIPDVPYRRICESGPRG